MTVAIVAIVAAVAVVVLALVAVARSSSAATARVETALVRGELLIARAELETAKQARRQSEARSAALEEELATIDQEPPLANDPRSSRARTLRLVRRWADAGAVPATEPTTTVLEPGAATPADEPRGS